MYGIESAPRDGSEITVWANFGNIAPQSMNQEQVWTHVQMMGDTPAYNELITSWTGIESAAASAPKSDDPQGTLFES